MTVPEIYEPVIGLEVHAQLSTRSKMFCGCSADYAGAAPNTHVCAVCSGMPGAMPVINRRALEAAMMTSLALDCRVSTHTRFDRKNYSYPDLPKGYQITQYTEPIGEHGRLEYDVEGALVVCGVTRVHLEEDTGKSVHGEMDGGTGSLVDYNRSGIPLMEIVSDPDLTSPLNAREFFAALRRILMYLGVSDGNLQEGSLRADVNVSLRASSGIHHAKVEIKNLNSFRAVYRSLEYEIGRQRDVIASGGAVTQETRGWFEREEVTLPQRSKEYAHDYRYFPEPDLPPLHLHDAQIEALRSSLPEMPSNRRSRLRTDFGLSESASQVLTDNRDMGTLFEATARLAPGISADSIANWVMGEVTRLSHEAGPAAVSARVTAARLASLLSLVESGTISGTAAKTVLEVLLSDDGEPGDIASRLDLTQTSDVEEIGNLVRQVLAENQGLIDAYQRGKTNVAQAVVGKVIKASGGKANPEKVSSVVLAFLSAPVEKQ